MPQLKSFLMEPDGIELYKNVEVNFISGKKAILTIFHNGTEQEQVTLSDFDDKDKLHKLFALKGFTKYTREEMVQKRGSTLTMNADNNLDPPVENLSPRQRQKERRENLPKLVEARKNYMMVGLPVG